MALVETTLGEHGADVAPPSWHAAVRARLRELHPTQARFVTSTAKRKVVRGGRRGGKTVGAASLAVERFLSGRRVLYAVPTQEQFERFWFEVKRTLEPALDMGVLYKNETTHVIEIPRTENRIRAKTAWNADTLRGDYANDLILDEYQLMNEDAWGVVGSPMLLDKNGDAVFIYTPPSFRTAGMTKAHDPRHAAKMFKTAQADTTGRWETFHFSSHDNPFISAEALDLITSDMTPQAYQQEIMAEDVEDTPGALWTAALLERTRVTLAQVQARQIEWARVAIALDPAATSKDTSDEMGIIAASAGTDGHGYVLRDASMRGTPAACARRAILLYDELQADVIVGEGNNGGEWIGTVIALVAADMARRGERASATVHYKMVHASRGKQTRAAPVAGLYEHERMHHVGYFPELESQLTGWVPGMASPDRLDACVWAGTELLLGAGPVTTRELVF